MQGIRPIVDLEWKISGRSRKSLVIFVENVTTVTPTGDTYKVVLTSMYFLQEVLTDELLLECRVAGPYSNLFNASKTEIVLYNTG